MSEEQEILDYEAHNARTALKLNKAEQEIERLTADCAFWEDAAHLIARWMAEDSDETHTQIVDRAGDRISEVRELAATEQEGET